MIEIKAFWEYFIAHEKEYRGYINYRMEGGTANMTETYVKMALMSQIGRIDDGLWVNLGKYVQGDYVLMPCFNPWEGKPTDECIALAKEIIASAPTVEGWEIRKILPTDMMLV